MLSPIRLNDVGKSDPVQQLHPAFDSSLGLLSKEIVDNLWQETDLYSFVDHSQEASLNCSISTTDCLLFLLFTAASTDESSVLFQSTDKKQLSPTPY